MDCYWSVKWKLLISIIIYIIAANECSVHMTTSKINGLGTMNTKNHYIINIVLYLIAPLMMAI